MCGITGFLDARGHVDADAAASVVRRMSDAVAHRGPDNSGAWVDGEAGIALGHRRLSIIDLSPRGHQPMMSATGRYVISFNGEVYNFRELRTELEPLGQSFRGGSDTEVMLAACEMWGPERAVEKFVGMFSFALWDRQTRTLRLVRDRLGVKPLYWCQRAGVTLFGSELKALMAHPSWRGEVDEGSAAALIRYGYVPGDATIFRDVHKLPPASILTYQAGGTPRIECYWRLRDVARHGLQDQIADEDAATDQLEALLRQAVDGRMISDVPLGAFLSGGVDSSTVVALMQAGATRKVRTFSIGFHDTAFNEAEHAKAVAAHLGTDHTEMYATAKDALDVIPNIPAWFDEPFADSSQIPTYLVSSMTRRHVTVALSGDGGDELFAGYPKYQEVDRLWRRAAMIPSCVRTGTAAALNAFPHALIEGSAARALPQGQRSRVGLKMRRLSELLAARSGDALYAELLPIYAHERSLMMRGEATREIELETDLAETIPDFTARMQYHDALNYLPDDILVKLDRCSMAVALEVREPLLDHRLVEFTWRLPQAFKSAHGRSKRLLRRVLDRYVPPALIERPKMGFSVPLADWLRGPLRDWAEGLLSKRRLAAEGLFRADAVRALWDEHQSRRANRDRVLWNILMFQAWKEHYHVA